MVADESKGSFEFTLEGTKRDDEFDEYVPDDNSEIIESSASNIVFI